MSGPQFPLSPTRRRIPITTWIGAGGTGLVALMGLAAGGFWMMLLMASLVVLPTALYGVLFRRTTWLRLPRRRTATAVAAGLAFAVLVGSSSAFAAAHPEPGVEAQPAAVAAMPTASPSSTRHHEKTGTHAARRTPTPTPNPTPVVETEEVSETLPVPFTSTTVDDATVPQGTSTITTAGVDGVETKTWTVTTTDGVETGRTLKSDVVTTPPVQQVTTNGTYVAPPPPPPAAPTCTNGTYVNSAGSTVCSPEVANSAPAGATAQCGDGTYSFSQSRRGTCSSHGGVAVWL